MLIDKEFIVFNYGLKKIEDITPEKLNWLRGAPHDPQSILTIFYQQNWQGSKVIDIEEYSLRETFKVQIMPVQIKPIGLKKKCTGFQSSENFLEYINYIGNDVVFVPFGLDKSESRSKILFNYLFHNAKVG